MIRNSQSFQGKAAPMLQKPAHETLHKQKISSQNHANDSGCRALHAPYLGPSIGALEITKRKHKDPTCCLEGQDKADSRNHGLQKSYVNVVFVGPIQTDRIQRPGHASVRSLGRPATAPRLTQRRQRRRGGTSDPELSYHGDPGWLLRG